MNHELTYWVEVFHNEQDQWYWRIRSANGQILATSEAYTTKQSAVEVSEKLSKCLVFSEFIIKD